MCQGCHKAPCPVPYVVHPAALWVTVPSVRFGIMSNLPVRRRTASMDEDEVAATMAERQALLEARQSDSSLSVNTSMASPGASRKHNNSNSHAVSVSLRTHVLVVMAGVFTVALACFALRHRVFPDCLGLGRLQACCEEYARSLQLRGNIAPQHTPFHVLVSVTRQEDIGAVRDSVASVLDQEYPADLVTVDVVDEIGDPGIHSALQTILRPFADVSRLRVAPVTNGTTLPPRLALLTRKNAVSPAEVVVLLDASATLASTTVLWYLDRVYRSRFPLMTFSWSAISRVSYPSRSDIWKAAMTDRWAEAVPSTQTASLETARGWVLARLTGVLGSWNSVQIRPEGATEVIR